MFAMAKQSNLRFTDTAAVLADKLFHVKCFFRSSQLIVLFVLFTSGARVMYSSPTRSALRIFALQIFLSLANASRVSTYKPVNFTSHLYTSLKRSFCLPNNSFSLLIVSPPVFYRQSIISQFLGQLCNR